MKRKFTVYLLIIFCCCFSIKGISQTRNITGVITARTTGEFLPGANIHVKGTNVGTITDSKGRFSLNVPPRSTTLTISFIGYLPQTIKLGSQTTINIQLEPDTKSLEQVIVVGYGEQKKESVTGAIVSVDNKELVKAPVSNISNALAGHLPGLITVQSNGEPGRDASSLKIRGISTLTEGAGSDPLILVDGVPRESLNLIDPNVVESISILKDASATAVYGVRGANGVILITTRKGSKGKPAVSLSSGISGQAPTRIPEFLGAYDYALLKNEGLRNDGLPEVFTPEMLQAFKDGSNPVLYPNRNWLKEFIKPLSLQHQDNLNISGGSDIVKYFVSLGYLNQQGSYNIPDDLNKDFGFDPNPKLKRYNFRSNFDINITKSLSASVRLGYIQRDLNYPGASTGDLMFSLMGLPPFSGAGVVDGKLTSGYLNDPLQAAGIGGRGNSPYIYLLNQGNQSNSDHTLNTSVELRQKLDFITKGLSVRAMGAYDDFYAHNVKRNKEIDRYSIYFDPANPEEDYSLVQTTDEGSFSFSESFDMRRKVYLESSFNYDREFGDHAVTGLVLYNQIKYYDPDFEFAVPEAVQGVVGRVTYNYRRKYLAEFNMGYNGSENFPKGKRFGFFPSYSLGWVPTLENFFPENNILTFMKIRGSYGVVGNDKIGGSRFLYLPSTYSFNTGVNDGYYFGLYGINRQHYNGSEEDKIGNPDVTWERAIKYNIGVELKFFKDKLSFEGDYFKEKRDNILINLRTVPFIVAADLPAANKGKVENGGFELQARWRDRIGAFSYWIGGNVAYAKNKILYADEPTPPYKWMAETDFSLGQWKAKRTNGLYNTPEEVTNRPFYSFYGNLVQPGDVKYIDINGDGVIDFNDEVPTGFSNFPEITWGAPIGVQYKGFELSLLLQGAGNIWGYFDQMLGNAFEWEYRATLAKHLNRWSAERYENGEPITMPRLSSNGVYSANGYDAGKSDFWMINKSYVRLKNLQISYRFNSNSTLMKKAGIQTLMIYVRGNNLITWSDMKDLDPERASGSSLVYPVMKVYNIGLNLGF